MLTIGYRYMEIKTYFVCRYDNQTIILSIPSNQPDLHNAKWLSIWSSKIKVSLAHTLFPADLNIPPSLDTLGQELEVGDFPISYVRDHPLKTSANFHDF